MIGTDDLDAIKTAWEAAAMIHPSGEPHCLIIADSTPAGAWEVLTYVEIAESATMVAVAEHVMGHLDGQPRPLWVAHAGVSFALEDVSRVQEYVGVGLQAAAEAGDDNVRELLTITVRDDDGLVSQHFTRPLNEPIGPVMHGRHVGYVADVLNAMWTALSGRRV